MHRKTTTEGRALHDGKLSKNSRNHTKSNDLELHAIIYSWIRLWWNYRNSHHMNWHFKFIYSPLRNKLLNNGQAWLYLCACLCVALYVDVRVKEKGKVSKTYESVTHFVCHNNNCLLCSFSYNSYELYFNVELIFSLFQTIAAHIQLLTLNTTDYWEILTSKYVYNIYPFLWLAEKSATKKTNSICNNTNLYKIINK